MSYLVLARKYRPQTFADLVGQEQVSRTLQNALATGRVAHAYLFSGPRGVGKTTAARLLAMSLSCQAENVADRPCGRCDNCLEIQSGQAVDVIEVDGASNRGINEIRDLRETVKYRPAKSRYKVYIIDEVHALTKDAFNALLKTLEEPPDHVVFIFATTETHKVLPTILSRCQRYDFRRIKVEDIVGRLAKVAEMENIEAETEALEIIARQAEGGLRDSLSLMDQAIAAGGGSLTAENVRRSLGLIDQTLVRQAVGACLNGRASEALAALDEAYLRGYDFKDLGGKILEYIRGLTLVKVDRKNAALMNVTEIEEKDFIQTSQGHSLETLHRHFDAWLKFQRDLSFSPQPRWLLEAQVIRLSQLAPLIPVSELVERLGRLLAQNPPPARPQSLSPAYVERAAGPEAERKTAAEPIKGPSEAQRPPASSLAAARSDVKWPDFQSKFLTRLDNYTRDLLRGAEPEVWSPAEVTLVLSQREPLAKVLIQHLEKSLQPLLKEALGTQPALCFSQPESVAPAADLALERLAAIKKTPEAMALMEALEGKFVDFLPGESEGLEEEAEDEVVIEEVEEPADETEIE